MAKYDPDSQYHAQLIKAHGEVKGRQIIKGIGELGLTLKDLQHINRAYNWKHNQRSFFTQMKAAKKQTNQLD